MTVSHSFAMNFRHGIGIMHIDPTQGPLSDKSDPLLNLPATALIKNPDPTFNRFVYQLEEICNKEKSTV